MCAKKEAFPMKILITLWLLVHSAFAFQVGNGKSLVITFDKPTGIFCAGDRNISVVPHPLRSDQGIAILPIDYYAAPQILNAVWENGEEALPFEINVTLSPYPTETLSVDNAKVCPPPETLQRIALEKAEAEAIYAHNTTKRYWNKPFILPIESITTSEYGSARTYNGVLKSYHGGVDFRAKTPLPILCSNDGVVVLVKERYYSGGTIIIDHGEGIYSCYFHLSEFNVKTGDTVTQGQNIALSGASGRITGPHLHFGFMLHGLQSDPLDFMAQIETLFSPPLLMAKIPK